MLAGVVTLGQWGVQLLLWCLTGRPDDGDVPLTQDSNLHPLFNLQDDTVNPATGVETETFTSGKDDELETIL